jgi:hypothetical protein
VLRAGVNRHLIDLVERGFIDHIAMNGAGAIHDYELARFGATTESVDRYIRTGEFGLWRETGELNDWIREAATESLGLGENAGRRILQSDYPHRDLSVLAAAYRARVPVTVHVGIGYDIIHEHPNCDGAALGAASYRDFLIFARAVEPSKAGAANFGSAVMGPEVYLKAPPWRATSRWRARHPELRDGRLRSDTDSRRPSDRIAENGPGYYFRPQKTILVRPWRRAVKATISEASTAPPCPRYGVCDGARAVTTAEILAEFPKRALVVGDAARTAGAHTTRHWPTRRETGIPRIGVIATAVTPAPPERRQ